MVNLGFYELLKHHSVKLVDKIRPNAKHKTQNFDVRLAPTGDGPLDKPADLQEVIDRIDRRGKLCLTQPTTGPCTGPLVSHKANQVLAILATVLSITLGLLLVLFILRHFKLQTLVAGLTLISSPKIVKAKATDPVPTVVCSNPYLTILATVVTIIASIMWICTHCRQLTWLRGYKYSRACTLYIFLYNCHFYVPLKIKHLAGHMQMYRIENPIPAMSLSYHKHCLWDSFIVDWKLMKMYVNGTPIHLPSSLTVPLRDKIKTRCMMTKDTLDIQFMIKQGTNWYNLTECCQPPIQTMLLHWFSAGTLTHPCKRPRPTNCFINFCSKNEKT